MTCLVHSVMNALICLACPPFTRFHHANLTPSVGAKVADRVRTDPRVTVMERTNLRYLKLEDLPGGCQVDLVTLDLSFISVVKVLPAVCEALKPGGGLIVLIKPQFEAGKDKVRVPVFTIQSCRSMGKIDGDNTGWAWCLRGASAKIGLGCACKVGLGA